MITTISIVICTRNRANLLKLCINELVKNTNYQELVEIIVIDNSSEDYTPSIVSSYHSDLKLIYNRETKIGLSYARNRGAKEAKGKWLLYIDDDGKIDSNTINELIYTITNFDFDMISGIFVAWHLYDTPKWFPNEWANYRLKGESKIREIGEDYVCGGMMAIKKATLLEIGGFPTNLGMSGDKVSYGEETYVENKLKQKGYKIGINPNMVLHHVVGKHKHSLRWILKAYFARGRDGAIANNLTWKRTLRLTLSFLERIIKNGLKSSYYLATKKDYYFQNFLLENIGPILGFFGMFSSLIKKK